MHGLSGDPILVPVVAARRILQEDLSVDLAESASEVTSGERILLLLPTAASSTARPRLKTEDALLTTETPSGTGFSVLVLNETVLVRRIGFLSRPGQEAAEPDLVSPRGSTPRASGVWIPNEELDVDLVICLTSCSPG
jgi:hypothetical protein|mmetsp:Transcript_38286/g.86965  ORF Transcript_38286/g.86965 Transcript_38286/m.86965 type:complete len:138 (-) Transcript_38286:1311-1724(-)